MYIGAKVYYEKATGNVVLNIGQRSGDVVETATEQDFESYSELVGRVPETIGMIQFEYGEYNEDYVEGGIITRIDLETLKPLFTYPDPADPETPQKPRPALSKEVEALKQADMENKEAIALLYEMQLRAGLNA